MDSGQTAFAFLFFVPLSIFVFIWAVIYHPIQRVKNFLFPTYLFDDSTGKVCRLVTYEGYDKHSSIVAHIWDYELNCERGISDSYWNLKPVTLNEILAVSRYEGVYDEEDSPPSPRPRKKRRKRKAKTTPVAGTTNVIPFPTQTGTGA